MPNPLDGPLQVEPSDDGQTWMVLRQVSFWSCAGRRVIVPEYYITDFASVPRFLWWLLPPWGRYLLHDRLYYQHNTGAATGLKRVEADRIFREVMLAAQVKPWMRWMLYAGVRVGGWAYWR
jgi:hypothetical protein